MENAASAKLRSGRWQLNIVGALLLGLLALSAWVQMRQPLSYATLIPLALIAYAAFKIIYELTWNRRNVPTLATGVIGRGKIADILQKDAAKRPADKYKVVDLGSGRGELARLIARAIPQAEVTGIELARIPHLQAQFLQRLFGPKNVNFKSFDFWLHDCADVDAVVIYLNQRLATKVGEKMRQEMKSGGMVISHTFPLLGGWVPIDVVEFRTPFKEVIYVYRKP